MLKLNVLLRVTCYVLLVTSIVFLVAPVLAQDETTPTPKISKTKQITPTPTPEDTVKSKIDEIKEKIASAVAERNLVTRKGIVGNIQKLEQDQITIDRNSKVKIIEVDELTKYTRVRSGKQTDIKFSDLHVSDSILAIGLYNKDSRKLLARFIITKDFSRTINGVVREVDIKGGTIKVEDKKKNKIYTIDIEKSTVIRNYTQGDGLVKTGLSKIEIGQRAHINGSANEEEEDRITASRILLLPGKAVGILTPPSTGQKTATSSATPTVVKPKLTPTPTKKPTSTKKPTATPADEPTP